MLRVQIPLVQAGIQVLNGEEALHTDKACSSNF
jgi:hypothetical protein